MQFSSVYILYGAVNRDVIIEVDCILLFFIVKEMVDAGGGQTEIHVMPQFPFLQVINLTVPVA